jgi:hypothetical protein
MKLLFESWRSYLKELENVSEIEIPKKFYISIYFGKNHAGVMKDLANGMVVKHEGKASSDIVGFADNPSNFMHFHGNVRDATIVMPGEDFMKINDSVVKIEYKNPDFLAQDGLKALYRLLEKNQKDKFHAQRVMQAIVDGSDLVGTMNKVSGKAPPPSDVNVWRSFFDNYELQEVLADTLYNNLEDVYNIESLYKLMTPTIQELSQDRSKQDSWRREVLERYMSPDFVRLIMYTGVLEAARFYKEENEWVVDSNILNIPSSSTVFIAGPTLKDKQTFQRMKRGELTPAEEFTFNFEFRKMSEIMSLIEEYGLDKKYNKVVITDIGTFNAAKNKWEKRRREFEKQKELSKAAE